MDASWQQRAEQLATEFASLARTAEDLTAARAFATDIVLVNAHAVASPSCRPQIREKMAESDVETVVQRALEKYPGEKPRIISDNGPQFSAKDFQRFVRWMGLTHVRTSPYYPPSNGKLELAWEPLARVRPAHSAGIVLRSNSSAVPGAKTDGAARGRPVLHFPHWDWHPIAQPSWQDATTAWVGCPSPFADSS